MKLTSHLFEAYLKCPTKTWLLSQEEQYTGNTYADWVEIPRRAKYGRPLSVVTDGLCSYPARSATPIARRPVVGSTIAPRIRISRSDDENGPCSGFEA